MKAGITAIVVGIANPLIRFARGLENSSILAPTGIVPNCWAPRVP